MRLATSTGDYAAFAGLVADYVGWCQARYHDDLWFIDQVFGHQSLADELRALPIAYGPPNGRVLLAWRDGAVCGGGAYRHSADGICEMKRLYVRPHAVGAGIGRQVAGALIEAARQDGYALMRLDTGKRFAEAIALYQSLGFETCVPYHDYPPDLMPYLVFMQRPLAAAP